MQLDLFQSAAPPSPPPEPAATTCVACGYPISLYDGPATCRDCGGPVHHTCTVSLGGAWDEPSPCARCLNPEGEWRSQEGEGRASMEWWSPAWTRVWRLADHAAAHWPSWRTDSPQCEAPGCPQPRAVGRLLCPWHELKRHRERRRYSAQPGDLTLRPCRCGRLVEWMRNHTTCAIEGAEGDYWAPTHGCGCCDGCGAPDPRECRCAPDCSCYTCADHRRVMETLEKRRETRR